VFDFRSDNVVEAHPAVMAAMLAANTGTQTSYGDDDYSRRMADGLRAVFATDCAAFPIATGTAANALALALLAGPGQRIVAQDSAHVVDGEEGAPEFYSGATLRTVATEGGKFRMDALAEAIAEVPGGAVTLTQATELGTLYTPAEIRAIADLAHAKGMLVHVDGSRFANAVVALDAHPADLTWRAGVDALSFGATKNGAAMAEAVIFFPQHLGDDFPRRRKRGGHTVSKMRFVSAQLEAYLAGDLWLANARHANAMAARLGAGLAAIPGVSLAAPVQANEVFVRAAPALLNGLEARGFQFFSRQEGMFRLVCAWNTSDAAVDAIIAAIRELAAERAAAE